MKKVTINDLARITKHSKSTVSNALNGKSGVNKKVREQIIETAKSLGYVPSEIARKMSLGNSKTIGVILRNIGSPFYSDVFDMLDIVSREKKYQIIFYNLRDNENSIIEALEFMRGQMVNGIILDSFGNNSKINKYIANMKIPTVIFGLNVTEDVSCVQADDEGASREAVDYAIGLGHKHFYFLSNGSNSYYEKRREQAIKERVCFHGLKFDESHNIFDTDITILVDMIIKNCPKDSVLFCYNDLFACKVISELMEREKYVPKNYSIISFDNLSIIPYALTTIDIPKREMAKVAIEHLLDIIENGAGIKKTTLKASLIIRGSVKKYGN